MLEAVKLAVGVACQIYHSPLLPLCETVAKPLSLRGKPVIIKGANLCSPFFVISGRCARILYIIAFEGIVHMKLYFCTAFIPCRPVQLPCRNGRSHVRPQHGLRYQGPERYIVNTDTNIIVYEKDSEKQVSAGGLTKYMTIALVLTNYADQLDSTFTMPFAISDYVHNTDNATCARARPLPTGKPFTPW